MNKSLRHSLKVNADCLDIDWSSCSKYLLAKGYLTTEAPKRERYLAALLLRYWYKVNVLYKELSNLLHALHFDREDVESLYVDSVLKSLTYLNQDMFEGKGDKECDKILNSFVYRTIDTMKINYMTYYSFDKRKLNISAISLDNELDEDGNTKDLMDTSYLDDNSDFLNEVDIFILSYLKRGKYVEALLLYLILYEDLFVNKSDVEDDKSNWQYSRKKALETINSLTERELNAFFDRYKVSDEARDYLTLFRYYSNRWITQLHDRALKNLAKDDKLKTLCY